MFEDTTGRDLSQFKLLVYRGRHPAPAASTDAWDDGTYTLTFEQTNPPTPGQPDKAPKVIPIAVGLLNPNGDEVLPTTMLEMTEARRASASPASPRARSRRSCAAFRRRWSWTATSSAEERAFLLAHDTDPFNKWEAGRALAKDVLARMITEDAEPRPGLARRPGPRGAGRQPRSGLPRPCPAPAGRG